VVPVGGAVVVVCACEVVDEGATVVVISIVDVVVDIGSVLPPPVPEPQAATSSPKRAKRWTRTVLMNS